MSKLIPPSIILLGLLLFCQIPASSAAQSIVLTDEVQMTLGKAFMAEGDYYRAITEYKKLIFLFPDSGHLPEALYQIGLAYYNGKDYESAVKSFAKVRQTYSANHFSSAAFHEGLSYEKLGRDDAAALAYERSRLFDASHPDAVNAHLGLALNAAEHDDITKVRSELNDFHVNYPEKVSVPVTRELYRLIDTYEARPKKSPGLAGTMSAIIPGSGQIYANHYKDGLMAFVVNGLFVAGTIAAIDNENYALAGIVGGIGVPFYVGNVYGAANAARKWNLSLSRNLRSDLSMTLDYHY